jgi:hypothetical protein
MAMLYSDILCTLYAIYKNAFKFYIEDKFKTNYKLLNVYIHVLSRVCLRV